jgi:hypothetical protein
MSTALSFGRPLQANCLRIRPPLARHPAATNHRRPDVSPAGEMVQSPAAANTEVAPVDAARCSMPTFVGHIVEWH